jgi:hypothetical protein
MLQVCRIGGRLHASCSECTSSGVPGAVQTRLDVSPEVEKMIREHRDRVLAMRDSFQRDTAAIIREARTREQKIAAADRIKKRWLDHVSDVAAAEAASPQPPPSGVQEIALACPWCGAGGETRVEILPAGSPEPWIKKTGRT